MATTIGADGSSVYPAPPAQRLHITDFLRDCHEYYRAATAGHAFPFPSHGVIRAGGQNSPYVPFLRFLLAGHASGKPRAWMETRVAEIAALGSRVWRDKYEADPWLEWRAELEENECDLCEVRFRQRPNPETRAALVKELRDDAAAKLARAAALEAQG